MLALAIGEVGFRNWMCREAGAESFAQVRDRYLGKQLAIFGDPGKFDPCSALRPGERIGSNVTINAFGLRGREVKREKVAGVLRVICFGGSSVFGTGSTSDATTWPARLEGLYNGTATNGRIEVLNAGVPGFVSKESTARFDVCCRRFAPDVVILCNEINDLLTRRISRLTYDPRNDAPVPQDTALERALSHCAIYLRARAGVRYAAKQEKVAAAIQDADSLERKSAVSDGLDREKASGTTDYFLPSDLLEYRATLLRFVALARECKAVPVLCTEPLTFGVGSDEATFRRDGGPLAYYFPDHPKLVAMLLAYHDVVRSVARETGASFIDCDALDVHDPQLWTDFVHTNDTGADALASQLLVQLVSVRVLPPR